MQQPLFTAGAQRFRNNAGEHLFVGEIIIACPAHANAAVRRDANRKIGEARGRIRPVELQGIGGHGRDHLNGLALEICVRCVQQHAEDGAQDHKHDRHVDADKTQPELFQHAGTTSR